MNKREIAEACRKKIDLETDYLVGKYIRGRIPKEELDAAIDGMEERYQTLVGEENAEREYWERLVEEGVNIIHRECLAGNFYG